MAKGVKKLYNNGKIVGIMFPIVLAMDNHRFTVPTNSSPHYSYLGIFNNVFWTLSDHGEHVWLRMCKWTKGKCQTDGLFIWKIHQLGTRENSLARGHNNICECLYFQTNGTVDINVSIRCMVSPTYFRANSWRIQLDHRICETWSFVVVILRTQRKYNLIVSRHSLPLALANQNAKNAQARCHRNRI